MCTSKYFAGPRPDITNEAKQTEFFIGTCATENKKCHQIKYFVYQMETIHSNTNTEQDVDSIKRLGQHF